MFCTECGKSNADSSKFCFSCGSLLKSTYDSTGKQPSTPSIQQVLATPLSILKVDEVNAQANPNSAEEDTRLWRAVIGIKKADYYLPRFSSTPQTEKQIGRWNWSASLVTSIWLLHRKLWKEAAIYFLITNALVFGLGVLQGIMQSASPGSPVIEGLFAFLWLGFVALLFALPGMWGTGWLQDRYRELINSARLQLSASGARETYLLAKGGTGLAGILYGVIVLGIGGIGVLAAIALPAYHDYTSRAKVAESLAYANSLSQTFTTSYENDGMIPSAESLAFASLKPAHVKDFKVHDNGTIQVFLNFSTLNGSSFALLPSLDATKKIQWACNTVTIPAKYMPQNCKIALEK